MSQPRKILYRGIPMIEGWSEKIIAAQKVVSFTAEGRDVPLIRYGDEHSDWKADQDACHDCRVLKGEFHVHGSEVEECPLCGGQAITYDCHFDDPAKDA